MFNDEEYLAYHAKIWAAIDGLAARRGFSKSRLSKRAGLDPTTLNPSKRVTRYGKPRWPSAETIVRLIRAADANFCDFALLVEQPVPLARRPVDEARQGL